MNTTSTRPLAVRLLAAALSAVLLAVLTAFAPSPPAVHAQAAELELHDASRLWIQGSSTVNRFTCDAETISGQGPLPTPAARRAAAEATEMTVPVQQFDCGNRRMTADMQAALQSKDHPTIRFELTDASVVAAPENPDGWYRLQATGTLTIAGTERPIEALAWGRPLGDGRYRVRGCQALLMTDFGIDPPTKFLGVVKVHDRIEVLFDLIGQPASLPDSAPLTLTSTDLPSCYD